MNEQRLQTEEHSRDIVYEFADFEYHVLTSELKRAGRSIPIRPQPRALLVYLLRNRARVVSRHELARAIWGDVVVGEGSVRVAVHELRENLGDTGLQQELVSTVRGRGYRFVGEVSERRHDHRVVAATAERSSELAGRVRELALLEAELEAAKSRGRVCLLFGSSGVGKSRLALELVRRAKAHGVRTARGHTDVDRVEPFAPVMRVIRDCLNEIGPALRAQVEVPSERLRLPAEIAFSDPCGAPLPDRARERVFDELANVLRSLCELGPWLLVIDDLQWADEATLAFFAHFAPEVAGLPLLLLFTSRKVARAKNRQLGRTVEAIARDPLHSKLELAELTSHEIAHLLKGDEVHGNLQLASRVHALTSGNPLFSLEISKLIRRVDSRDAAALLDEPNLELRAVIARRLHTLSDQSHAALSAASVLAHSFSVGELSHVLDASLDTTMDAVDACLDAGVFLEQSHSKLSFTHPLLREVAYDELRSSERAQLHLRAARGIERYGDSSSRAALAELAHHYYRAAASGAAERAVECTRRCGEAAMRDSAYDSAARYFDQALECVALVPNFSLRERLELRLSRASALRASGINLQHANELLATLANEAVDAGFGEIVARAALAYSGHSEVGFSLARFVGATDPREILLLERALAMIDAHPSELRVLLLCALAWALAYSNHHERCGELCADAVSSARRCAAPWLLARALLVQVYACASPANLQARLAACDELVELVRRCGLQQLEVVSRVTRAVCRLEVADVEGAKGDEDRAMTLAEALKSPALRVGSPRPSA